MCQSNQVPWKAFARSSFIIFCGDVFFAQAGHDRPWLDFFVHFLFSQVMVGLYGIFLHGRHLCPAGHNRPSLEFFLLCRILFSRRLLWPGQAFIEVFLKIFFTAGFFGLTGHNKPFLDFLCMFGVFYGHAGHSMSLLDFLNLNSQRRWSEGS